MRFDAHRPCLVGLLATALVACRELPTDPLAPRPSASRSAVADSIPCDAPADWFPFAEADLSSAASVQAAFRQQSPAGPGGGGGRFGPTLPRCGYESYWETCGSSLPGAPPIRCRVRVYCCTWPNGSKGCMRV